jgi:hypothetical protein
LAKANRSGPELFNAALLGSLIVAMLVCAGVVLVSGLMKIVRQGGGAGREREVAEVARV